MKKVGSNIWEELGRREELIRNAYDKAKVVLKPKQGLSLDWKRQTHLLQV
jgi:hypothetical protein